MPTGNRKVEDPTSVGLRRLLGGGSELLGARAVGIQTGACLSYELAHLSRC